MKNIKTFIIGFLSCAIVGANSGDKGYCDVDGALQYETFKDCNDLGYDWYPDYASWKTRDKKLSNDFISKEILKPNKTGLWLWLGWWAISLNWENEKDAYNNDIDDAVLTPLIGPLLVIDSLDDKYYEAAILVSAFQLFGFITYCIELDRVKKQKNKYKFSLNLDMNLKPQLNLTFNF